MNSKCLSLHRNECEHFLTEKHAHLKAEDIDVHALVLQPCLFVSDVDENARVYYEACEEHYHQVVAEVHRGVRAAISVGLNCVFKQAHCRVHHISFVAKDVS